MLFQIFFREVRHQVRVAVLVDDFAGLDAGLLRGPQDTLLAAVHEAVIDHRMPAARVSPQRNVPPLDAIGVGLALQMHEV